MTNRPRKFRAWLIEEKRMSIVLALRLDLSGNVNGILADSGEYLKPFILMEWMGQLDASGREIYERDIVDAPCTTEFGMTLVRAHIGWWKEASQFTYHVAPPGLPLGGIMSPPSHCRVLGNVLEHKDLLPPEAYKSGVIPADEMSPEPGTSEV